jgi:uncharacterized protein (TIGR03067 family)
MKLQLLAAMVLVLLSGGSVRAQDEAAKKELAKFQGVWELVSGEEEGQPAAEVIIQNLKIVIKGDQLTLQGDAGLIAKAAKVTIKVDPSTTPKCIDFKVDAGSEKGLALEGIYEWKGNEVKICVHQGNDRPLQFETKAGSKRLMFVMKKQKP